MKSILWFLVMMTMLSGCSSCSNSGRKMRVKQLSNRQDAIQPLDTAGDYQPPPATTGGKQMTLSEIIARAEPGVFMVRTYDGKGKGIGQGTGFFIESTGVGISNYHVFEGGKSWQIRTFDGKQYEVENIIKESEAFDYVVFQVKTGTKPVSFLPISSLLPSKGEDIVVLGNPRGLESTVSRGIVSSIRNFKKQRDALIQIDAAISPGSSGSPVMNMRGEVVGIATMKVDKCENCNFAFNIDMLGRQLDAQP